MKLAKGQLSFVEALVLAHIKVPDKISVFALFERSGNSLGFNFLIVVNGFEAFNIFYK